jgi:hypothetical protein
MVNIIANFKAASLKLADHLPVAGLFFGGGSLYVAMQLDPVHGALFGGALAFIIWLSYCGVAFFIRSYFKD